MRKLLIKFTAPCLILILGLAFLAKLPQASADDNQPLQFRLWSEFEKWDSVKKKFSSLAKYPVTLHIGIPQNEIETGRDFQTNTHFQELVSLLKDAKDHQLSVFLWPLLDKKDGYWFNQWNAKLFAQYTLRLKENLKNAGATFDGISFDIEFNTKQLEEYGHLAKKLKFGTIIKKFKASQDPKQFQEALKIIQDLCVQLRKERILTHAVILPFVLEDFLHVSKKPQFLQHELGFAIPYGYVDDISVMSYRTEYQVVMGKMNSRIVYDQAMQSKKYLGPLARNVSIDVGIVGDMLTTSKVKGYKNPADFKNDVIAARAAGIHRIGIYALDGMDNVDAWLNQDFAPKKPKKSFKWSTLEKLTASLYKILSR